MRKDAFFFLLIMLTTVADEDLAAAVLDKEIDLNCTLKPWEVTLLASQLLQVKLKNLPPDVKATPAYKSEFKSTSNRIAHLKRKPDFRPELLLPKKVARTGAQRVDEVTKHFIMSKQMLLTPGETGSVRRGESCSTYTGSNPSC